MKSRMSEIGRDAQGATRSQSRKQENKRVRKQCTIFVKINL